MRSRVKEQAGSVSRRGFLARRPGSVALRGISEGAFLGIGLKTPQTVSLVLDIDLKSPPSNMGPIQNGPMTRSEENMPTGNLGRWRSVLASSFPLLCLIGFSLLPRLASAQAQDPVDPRGPVAGWLGKTLVDAEGVQAVNYTYAPPSNSAPWQPQWIWVGGMRGVPVSTHFRKDFSLPAGDDIANATVKVTADRSYRLWVNGRLVSHGPADPGNDEYLFTHWSHQWLYNLVEIGPYLHPGVNSIAAEVINAGIVPSFSLGHPGFAMEAKVTLATGAPIVIATGSDWKAKAVEALSEGALSALLPRPPSKNSPHGLLYDARLDNPDWRSGALQESEWESAQTIDSIWGPVVASQIPEAMEAVWPVQSIEGATANVTTTAPFAELGHSIRVGGDGAFDVYFGRVLSGYVSMKVVGAAGTVITLEPVETRQNEALRPAQITLRDGETIFEYPLLDSFSMVRIKVSHSTKPVEFVDLRATFASQPVQYRGSFTSSDPYLNRLWTTARWLLQICMQDRYLDSPGHQEPIGDFGDYLIESLENDYAFNEPWLAKQDMRKFAGILDNAGSVNFHTSYSMLWLQMLMDYYDHTGDESLLRDLKPTVDRLLDRFATFRGANGLLSEAPNYMFMDWVVIDGFQTHHPPAVIGQGYLTAFYFRALADGARLARLTGDHARETKYEKLRADIYTAFNRELWDEKAGLYRDGKPFQNHQKDPNWLPEDKNIVTHSVQGNSLAVLYDLAPPERQQEIMERLSLNPPMNVQPYFMHFVFAAEAHAGVFNRYGWDQMQRWHLNLETKTFNEDWYGGDWSHAWGGTPLIQMSARILGVEPAAPGFKRISIRPQICGLLFAKGIVPTQMGDVSVSWKKEDSAFTLDVTAPDSTSVEVTLPDTHIEQPMLIVDGSVSTLPFRLGTKTVLTGGAHHLIVRSQE